MLELDSSDAGGDEEVQMSDGSSDRMTRAGHFAFAVDGKPVRAYNPYCAYNDDWRCPLPPLENWLDVEIRAGEQRFH